MRGPLAVGMCWVSLSALAAVDGGSGEAASADGGAAEARKGPDVSKMPFTPESIKQVVSSRGDEIQKCYEEMLAQKGQKAPEGKLQAHWVITKEGMVKGAKIVAKGTTLKDAKLHECVVAVLGTLEFPKPPRDQPIDYPFNLKAEK